MDDLYRYTSPYRDYVTGDVLRDLIIQGWSVTDARLELRENRTRIFTMTLTAQDNQQIILRVLDNPFVRTIASQAITS